MALNKGRAGIFPVNSVTCVCCGGGGLSGVCALITLKDQEGPYELPVSAEQDCGCN